MILWGYTRIGYQLQIMYSDVACTSVNRIIILGLIIIIILYYNTLDGINFLLEALSAAIMD